MASGYNNDLLHGSGIMELIRMHFNRFSAFLKTITLRYALGSYLRGECVFVIKDAREQKAQYRGSMGCTLRDGVV